jgi:hypothetical protein
MKFKFYILGKKYEDMNKWCENLEMVANVQDLNVNKLFKVTTLNFRGKAKD